LVQLAAVQAVAADVLCLCKFLAPDAIPLALLHTTEVQLPERLATIAQDTLALNQVIAALLRYSLVERTGNTLTVHRLVQAIGREQLESEKQQTWAALAVKLVKAAFPYDSGDFRTWSACAQLLPYALAATEYAEQLTVAPNDVSLLLDRIGGYLSARGEYGAAQAAYERAVKISEAALGPDHPDVGASLSNLGTVLRLLGQLHEAKAAHERAVKISEAALGPDHPTVGIRLNNLGVVLQALGQLPEARTYCVGNIESGYSCV
jgi:tetratricopeptide (TPR) repeat protein